MVGCFGLVCREQGSDSPGRQGMRRCTQDAGYDIDVRDIRRCFF